MNSYSAAVLKAESLLKMWLGRVHPFGCGISYRHKKFTPPWPGVCPGARTRIEFVWLCKGSCA